MVNKKVISLNVFFSLFQILITGLSYYFLYKYLLNSVGSELMGVWAIVLSISSTANIANLGIGASVVRYTATYKAKNELYNINNLIHTSTLFLSMIFFIIILIVYLIAPLWLDAVISKKYYNKALELVPLSLVCLFLNAIASVFLSCIDGLQKNYLRSVLYILSFIILLGMSYLFVPKHGLIGVAYAQLWQAGFLLVGSLVSLKIAFKEFKLFSFRWDKAIFKKIFSFGLQEQVISICQLFFDPFTKSMLGTFGNLNIVTYYEMANRLILQLRGFLVSANQVFIPVYATLDVKSAQVKQKLYRQVFSTSFLVSILWISFIFASIIPVSKIWIGNINREFIIITILLSPAYWCNILLSPAYFSNIGSATLKDNVVGNIIIALLNVVLCIILGYYFKGYGVVVGWSLALAIGSMYTMFKYHRKNMLKTTQLLTKADLLVVVLCCSYCAFSLLLFIYNSDMNVWLMFATDISIFLAIGIVIYLIHPLPKTLLAGIKD